MRYYGSVMPSRCLNVSVTKATKSVVARIYEVMTIYARKNKSFNDLSRQYVTCLY